MEFEIQPRKRKPEKYKHHVDLSNDPEIAEMKDDYSQSKYMPTEKVAEEDMQRILKRYATDKDMDLYTIAEVFCVSEHALQNMLKDKKYQQLYQMAKKIRGDVLVHEGYKTACTPFEKIQNGEEVSMVEVAAAKLKSNYCLAMGQALNPEWDNRAKGGDNGGGINLVVNTGIKIGI